MRTGKIEAMVPCRLKMAFEHDENQPEIVVKTKTAGNETPWTREMTFSFIASTSESPMQHPSTSKRLPQHIQG